ncbi:MAG: exosortase-dependent surface protein XDP1 [Halioglobus sp.]
MRLASTLLSAALLTGSMLLPATSAMSATQVWDFDSASQSFNRNRNGNRLTLTSSDGVTLRVTGWSDTRDRNSGDTIQNGRLIWARNDALALRNRDEGGSNANHRIDSVTNDPSGEYDMLMLEFDEEVRLEGIDLDLAVGGALGNSADISVLAWDQSGASALNGRTWDGILASNGGGYNVVDNYNNVGVSYYGVNPGNVSSSRWLIGVYNPLFGAGGSAGNDSFLLSALQTSNTLATVPVPGSLALALMGLCGLRSSRRDKSIWR